MTLHDWQAETRSAGPAHDHRTVLDNPRFATVKRNPVSQIPEEIVFGPRTTLDDIIRLIKMAGKDNNDFTQMLVPWDVYRLLTRAGREGPPAGDCCIRTKVVEQAHEASERFSPFSLIAHEPSEKLIIIDGMGHDYPDCILSRLKRDHPSCFIETSELRGCP